MAPQSHANELIGRNRRGQVASSDNKDEAFCGYISAIGAIGAIGALRRLTLEGGVALRCLHENT